MIKAVIESRLKMRAASRSAVETVMVIAEQLPEAWLPRLDKVQFDRISHAAAREQWETTCLPLFWIAASVTHNTLTVTVIEGNRCSQQGTGPIYERTPAGWRLTGGGGFGSAGSGCACR